MGAGHWAGGSGCGQSICTIGPEGECLEDSPPEDATYIKAGDELDPSELLAEVSLDD